MGELKHKSWTNAAEGNLQGKRYLFKTSGFFNIKTRIIDVDYHVVVGEITYGFWRTKATIEYDDVSYGWAYNNSWHTKWRISQSGETLVDYRGTSSKGQIDGLPVPPFVLLSGLFISNHFQQVVGAMVVAIFVPVVLT